MDTPSAYNIKTYNAIAPVGLQRFAAGDYTVGPDVEGADAMLLRSHKLSADELTPGLRAIARAGAGVNNVPVEACSQAGIVVFNTPWCERQLCERTSAYRAAVGVSRCAWRCELCALIGGCQRRS